MTKEEQRKVYFSKKLSELMNSSKLNQSQMADIVHGNQSLISKWIKKENFPTIGKLTLLMDYFKLPIQSFDILTLSQEEYEKEIKDPRYCIKDYIPPIDFPLRKENQNLKNSSDDLVSIRICTEAYKQCLENHNAKTLFVDKNFLEIFYGISNANNRELFAVKFLGNSMEPYIHSEDFVLAEKTNKVFIGEACVAILKNGELIIRRYASNPTPTLIADNSQYYSISGAEEFEIFGKVLGIIPKQK